MQALRHLSGTSPVPFEYQPGGSPVTIPVQHLTCISAESVMYYCKPTVVLMSRQYRAQLSRSRGRRSDPGGGRAASDPLYGRPTFLARVALHATAWDGAGVHQDKVEPNDRQTRPQPISWGCLATKGLRRNQFSFSAACGDDRPALRMNAAKNVLLDPFASIWPLRPCWMRASYHPSTKVILCTAWWPHMINTSAREHAYVTQVARYTVTLVHAMVRLWRPPGSPHRRRTVRARRYGSACPTPTPRTLETCLPTRCDRTPVSAILLACLFSRPTRRRTCRLCALQRSWDWRIPHMVLVGATLWRLLLVGLAA